MVEHHLAKVEIRVRFPVAAPERRNAQQGIGDLTKYTVHTHKNGSVEPFLCVFWFYGELGIKVLVLGIKDICGFMNFPWGPRVY